jgi:hypothetical protein
MQAFMSTLSGFGVLEYREKSIEYAKMAVPITWMRTHFF